MIKQYQKNQYQPCIICDGLNFEVRQQNIVCLDCGCLAQQIQMYGQEYEERPFGGGCGSWNFISQKPIKIQNGVDKFMQLFEQYGQQPTDQQLQNFRNDCDRFLSKHNSFDSVKYAVFCFENITNKIFDKQTIIVKKKIKNDPTFQNMSSNDTVDFSSKEIKEKTIELIAFSKSTIPNDQQAIDAYCEQYKKAYDANIMHLINSQNDVITACCMYGVLKKNGAKIPYKYFIEMLKVSQVTISQRLKIIKKDVQEKDVQQKYKILSISGGGTKIIYFFGILESLLNMYQHCFPEKQFDVLQIFDMISGTSAGSILSMLLQLGIQLDKIRDILFEACKEIFGTSYQNKYLTLMKNGYMYENKKFKAFVQKYAGDKKVFELPKDFCVPSYQINCDTQQSNLKLFTKEDSNMDITDIILASSSASFYFEPYQIDGCFFIDGGIFQNSPCELSVTQAKNNKNNKKKNIYAISIEPLPYQMQFKEKNNFIRQINNVSSSIFRAQSQLSQYNTLQQKDVKILYIDLNIEQDLPIAIQQLVEQQKKYSLDDTKNLSELYMLGHLVGKYYFAKYREILDSIFLSE